MRRASVLVALLLIPVVPFTSGADEARAGGLDPLVREWASARGTEEVRVLVRFDHAPTAMDAATLAARGFTPLVRYSVVPVFLAAGPARLAPSLASVSGVAFVEADRELPYLLDTATTAIRAKPLWDSTHTRWPDTATAVPNATGIDGAGVGIAIVDSGVDATHPDLLLKDLGLAAGRPWTTLANYKIVGRDSVELAASTPASGFVEANTLAVPLVHTDNTGGHGTHVAGTAAGKGIASDGKYKGAAPGAHLVGYGAGEALAVGLALAAFDHIYLHGDELGIRVVSNSWGGPGDWQPDFSVTQAARRLVTEKGLVVVFAAGNNGGDGSTISTSVWANIPEVISVANWNEGLTYADGSSSRGAQALERTWPDFAAVGTNVISAAATAGPVTYYGNAQDFLLLGSEAVVPAPTPTTVEAEGVIVGPYASFTGTSMATPGVSGVVALMLQANPALSPAEVREILRETAVMPAGRTYAADGKAIGRGLVDAARAVAVALRMADGLSFENALLSATAAGGPLAVNAAAPDAGALLVRMITPAAVNAGVPATLSAVATGGDEYGTYTFSWDLDGDAVADAAGPSVTTTFAAVGSVPVTVNVTQGNDVSSELRAISVVSAFVPVFSDGMEDGEGLWTVVNGGTTGLASGFDLRRYAEAAGQGVFAGGFFGAHTGRGFWHAGVRHTPGMGGWAYLPGSASTLAVGAPVAVGAASEVRLRFFVTGQSPAPLIVEAKNGTAWQEIHRIEGIFLFGGGELFYTERDLNVTAFSGAGTLEFRFRYEPRLPPTDPVGLLFWSFFESESVGGWGLDDIRIDARY
ncbi:MAG: S8 family serine peptidase [Methanobacteriota archaeon]